MSSQQPYDYYSQNNPPPPPQDPYQSSGYTQYPPNPNPPGMYPPAGAYGYGVPVAPSEPGRGMALAGLIVGIVSLVFSITIAFWFCGLPISIVGIVLSIMGRRSVSRRTMATVGLVLSIIALALGLIFGALGISYIITHPSS